MNPFIGFPKIARLSRDVVVTEKLDGTNAQVFIKEFHDSREEFQRASLDPNAIAGRETDHAGYLMFAGSRTRWIRPGDDNFAFALWVKDNVDSLFDLGPGQHFGEWWGKGIQRNYGMTERKFSLFNVHRWDDALARPECCDVVPTLYSGVFDTDIIDLTLKSLARRGSLAAPGFMNPEGIIIFHTASGELFKKTVVGDESPKSQLAKAA